MTKMMKKKNYNKLNYLVLFIMYHILLFNEPLKVINSSINEANYKY